MSGSTSDSRAPRWALSIALAAVVALALPSAAAGEATDFYGVWANGTLGAERASRATTMDRQAALGARHLRQFFEWGAIEWRQGEYNFTDTDEFVADASRRGLRVLPVLTGSTDWNTTRPAENPPRGVYPPRDPEGFGEFARVLVARYGPRGVFWFENRDLPYLPIVSWQVWNEPSIPFFWATGPDARLYTELLQAASRGIRSAAPDTEVVAAGIPNSTLGSPMISFIRGMYEAGAADAFDVLSVHPYAADVTNVLATLRSARHEMDLNGDASPIWASEFGWATGGPPTSLTVGEDEQAALVESSLRLLGSARVRLNLRGATYYAWQDVPPPPDRNFWTEHTGLLRVDGSLKPAAHAYARVAGVVPIDVPATVAEHIVTGALPPAPAPENRGPSGYPTSTPTSPVPGALRVVTARPTNVRPRRRLLLRVGCWSPIGGTCLTRLTVDTRTPGGKRARLRVGRRRFAVRSGRSVLVGVPMTTRSRRLLARKGRLRVRVLAKVTDLAGGRAESATSFWLRRP